MVMQIKPENEGILFRSNEKKNSEKEQGPDGSKIC